MSEKFEKGEKEKELEISIGTTYRHESSELAAAGLKRLDEGTEKKGVPHTVDAPVRSEWQLPEGAKVGGELSEDEFEDGPLCPSVIATLYCNPSRRPSYYSTLWSQRSGECGDLATGRERKIKIKNQHIVSLIFCALNPRFRGNDICMSVF